MLEYKEKVPGQYIIPSDILACLFFCVIAENLVFVKKSFREKILIIRNMVIIFFFPIIISIILCMHTYMRCVHIKNLGPFEVSVLHHSRHISTAHTGRGFGARPNKYRKGLPLASL